MQTANLVGDDSLPVESGGFIGPYRVRAPLAAGGEGESFIVEDRRANRGPVLALKLFRTVSPAVERRVRAEFERLVGLDHRSVVRVRDVGRHESDGRLYLVTELVNGPSLRSIAELSGEAQRRVRWQQVAVGLADALAYLHARGLVHGDVSPENVRLSEDGTPVLLDVGAWLPGASGAAFGTLGYMAPEALVGQVGVASDLFGLGASLFAAWTGAGPFGDGADSLPRLLGSAAPPLLSAVRRGSPSGWDELVADLLRRSANERPSSAREVLRRMRRLAEPGAPDGGPGELLPPHPGGDVLAGVFVGRERERALLAGVLRDLAEGASRWSVLALCGLEGSGRRRLIEQARQDLAIAQLGSPERPTVTVFRGSVAALFEAWSSPAQPAVASAGPAVPDDPERQRHGRLRRLVTEMEDAARQRPLCIVLEDDADAEQDAVSLASFVAGAPPSGRLLFLLPAPRPLARVGALDLEVGPLLPDEITQLAERAAGEPVPAAAVARVIDASGGHAGIACQVTRQLVEALRQGRIGRFEPERDADLGRRLARAFERLSSGARRALAGLALGMGSPEAIGTDDVGALWLDSLDEARSAGWLRAADRLALVPQLSSASHAAVVLDALADPDLRAVAERAATQLPEADGRRGLALVALGRGVEAVRAFRLAAMAAIAPRAGLDPSRAPAPTSPMDRGPGSHGDDAAARWLGRLYRLDPRTLTIDERIRLADRLAMEGSPVEADEVLGAISGSSSGTDPGAGGALDRAFSDPRLSERRAWLRARAGDLEGARQLLERALDHPDLGSGASALRALLRARLARVLFGMRRFSEAGVVAASALGDPEAAPLAAESALLAQAYWGDLAGARRTLAELPEAVRSSPRFGFLAALLEHLAGGLDAALEGYRRALADADRAGDVHTAAAVALNLGALGAEAGRYGEALAAAERAISELGRIGTGKTSELATALFNAAMLLAELHDLPGARGLADRLRIELDRRPGADRGAWTYLDAELSARQGRIDTALAQLAKVATGDGLAPPTGPPSALSRAAALSAIDLLARAGRTEEAASRLATLEEARSTGSPDRAAELRLARARILSASDGPGPAALRSDDPNGAAHLADALAGDAARAAEGQRRPLAWRTALAAARLFQRLGQSAEAARSLARAHQWFEEVRMSTPVDHRPGLAKDPEARLLAAASELAGLDEGGGAAINRGREIRARAERADGRLRRLLRINKRLNSELRLPRLLELIMDTVIELTEAERGFVLLEDDKGELVVKAARNIDQQTLEASAFEVSRSIARQAVQGGAPIVTIDAAGDPRFREAMSVSDLHLRSVLAVPLHIKGRAAGTVYVDNRLRQGAFTDEDVQLVLDFTEQAAIAVENARLLSELRKRERRIEVLNQRLRGELEARKEELSGMKQELRENREALAIRYDYRNIVGRTPRMLELFRLLDRLTDTALPVVVQGESGTGKELVARALHFNGPRRAQAFVSENCAAIPETLLESTLFGAVRGAFTGADHDSRGLFEIADGGTLFLDEVAEMSPGMQGKLLRILQTGELRRVGGERTRKVDVRIVAATNRDLGRLVEEGKFRQDLFFRLSVARIELPPLRERREDIPAIVEHLLAKASTSTSSGGSPPGALAARPKRIQPEALARLVAYRWPGNVRELENELMRAAALSGDVIGVGDLSPHVAGTAEAALTSVGDPDSLALKPRVERLERALLREALTRCGGNQTKAAEALGLSRFGLQKKLRRYGFT